MARGILDTSTLILLGRIQDTDPLPAEPLITAITLVEPARVLLEAGEPSPVVSARLGHASPGVTLSIYSNVLDRRDQEQPIAWRSFSIGQAPRGPVSRLG